MTVNPQMSLLDLTLEAGIPGDVMSLIDCNLIVYVLHHDIFLVDGVNDGLDKSYVLIR